MKQKATVQEHHMLLSRLQQLPRKILLLHGTENIPEFVLHELCHEKCFNVHKAAYFVDNPDFDCLKGVAGINHNEGVIKEDIWSNSDRFSQKMKASQFNQKVRGILHKSVHNRHLHENDLFSLLAREVGMQHPKLYHWDMKYDNHGLLIIEDDDDNHVWKDEYLSNSVYLFGFCPVH